MEIEGHNGIDRIGKLWDKQKRVDRIDDVLVGRVDSPVAIEDRVTDPAMTVDIGVIYWCHKPTLWWKCRILYAHLQVEKEDTACVGASWWTCVVWSVYEILGCIKGRRLTLHDNLPHREI